MHREKLTIKAIQCDLVKMANDRSHRRSDSRFSYIILFTMLAILLGLLTKDFFIGMPVFCIAVYYIVRFTLEQREHRTEKAAILSTIERGEISISRETFSHISNDMIFDPNGTRRASGSVKEITCYHFSGGLSWKEPYFVTHGIRSHYEWSKDYRLSAKGLQNISVKGNEFYFVSLQEHPDIAYIYPCKNFELDKSLEK